MSNLPLLRRAIEDHLGTGPMCVIAPGPAPLAMSERTVALEPGRAMGWQDLAGVRAGAAARERAVAERQAQGTVRHVLARVLGAKTDERAWRIGADGEVFTVNAKHHPRAAVWVGGDTVMINGRRVPYVRTSRYEAARASRLLAEHVGFSVPVIGLVAVVGARRGFTVKAQPSDGAVAVVTQWGLVRFLSSQPRRLDLRHVDAIHEMARRSTTWHR